VASISPDASLIPWSHSSGSSPASHHHHPPDQQSLTAQVTIGLRRFPRSSSTPPLSLMCAHVPFACLCAVVVAVVFSSAERGLTCVCVCGGARRE
jgi:hypothetical protein